MASRLLFMPKVNIPCGIMIVLYTTMTTKYLHVMYTLYHGSDQSEADESGASKAAAETPSSEAHRLSAVSQTPRSRNRSVDIDRNLDANVRLLHVHPAQSRTRPACRHFPP